MKKLLFAAVLSVSASGAMAGNYDKVVVVEPEIVETAAAESAGDDTWVLGLMTFLTIVLGAAQ